MQPCRKQRGITLIELLMATVAGAILLAGLNNVVKTGLDAQVTGRGSNELTYQARFALERMTDIARNTAPKELANPVANTTGDWFAPTGCTGAACIMYCRNSSNQLIETIVTDTSCAGTTVLANNVSTLSAQLPSSMGATDRAIGIISLSLADNLNNSMTLSSSIRFGGGTR